MIVYLVNLSVGLAGIERRFANIWQALRRRGNVRPVLVVPDTLGELLSRSGLTPREHPDVWLVPEHRALRHLGRVPLPPIGDHAVAFARSRALARALRPVWDRITTDPTAVVHIGMNCSALEPPQVPLVYECVDSTLTQLGTRHFVKAAARRCVVHCQTERIRAALERVHAGRPRAWTTVVSPSYFASYPEAETETARDPLLVAFVGRLAEEKNPLLFIEALALLRRQGQPFRALIVGTGPLRPLIVRRLAEFDLQTQVAVTDTRTPAALLSEAAVFVSLQTGDNYGSQSLLEAMGAGCAVIASDVGETRKVVDAVVGCLVQQTPEAVAAAVAELLANPERTAALGAAARQRALTQYSADRYAAFLEGLYHQAVDLRNHVNHNGAPTIPS